MKRRLSTRMKYLQRLLAQSLEDINFLLAHFPEEEVKRDVLLLLELCTDYRVARINTGAAVDGTKRVGFRGVRLDFSKPVLFTYSR